MEMDSISGTSDVSTDEDEDSENELAPNGTGVREEQSNRCSIMKRSSCFKQVKSRGSTSAGASTIPSITISNKLLGIEKRSQTSADEIIVFKFKEKHVRVNNNVDACTTEKCSCDPVASCEILEGFVAALKAMLEYRSRMCPYVVHACLEDDSFGIPWTWMELGEDFYQEKQGEESAASSSATDSSGEGVDKNLEHADSNSSSFEDIAVEEVTVGEPVRESSPGGGTAHSAPDKPPLRSGSAIQACLAGSPTPSNMSDISDSPLSEEKTTENVRNKPIDLSSGTGSSETIRSNTNKSPDTVFENPIGKQRTTYSALWVYSEALDVIRNQNIDLLPSSEHSNSIKITEGAEATSPQCEEENCEDKATDPKTTPPTHLSLSSPKSDRVDAVHKDPKDSAPEIEAGMIPEDLSLSNQRASEATVCLIPQHSLSVTSAKTSTSSMEAPESVDPVSCPVVDPKAATTNLATELSNPEPAKTKPPEELDTSAETEMETSLTLSSLGEISNASSCPLVIDTSATSTPEKQQVFRTTDETAKVTVAPKPSTSENLGSVKHSEDMCARILPYVSRNSVKRPLPESLVCKTDLLSRKRASTEERGKGLPISPKKESRPSLPLPESTPSQVNKIPEATAVASIQTYVSLMKKEEKEKAEMSPGGRKSLDVSKETPQTKLQGGKPTSRKSLRQRGMRETDAVCLDLENGSDTNVNTNDSQPVVPPSNPETHDSSKADDNTASSKSNTKPDETPKPDLKKQGKRSLPKASRPAPARVKKARMAESTSSRESGEIRTDSEDDPVRIRKDQDEHVAPPNNDGSDFGKRILRPRTGTPTELDSSKQSRTIASLGKPVSNDGKNETTEKSKTESKTRASKTSQSPKKNQSKKEESLLSSSTEGANHGSASTPQPPASDVQVISEVESDSGESQNSEERLEKKTKRASDRKLLAERGKNSAALQSKASVSNVRKGTESESDSGESQSSEMPLMERLEKRKNKRASIFRSQAEHVKKPDPISFRKPGSLPKDAESDAGESLNSEERLEKNTKRASDGKLSAERGNNSAALQSKASVSNVRKETVSESESDSGESQSSEMPLMERLEKRKKKRTSIFISQAEHVKKSDPISFRKPGSLPKDAESDAGETQNSEMPAAEGLEMKNTTPLSVSGEQRKSASDATVPLDPKVTDKPLKDKHKESDQQKPMEGNADEDDDDIEILDEYIVKPADKAKRSQTNETRKPIRRNSLDNATPGNRTRSSSTNSNNSEGQEKNEKIDASKVGSIYISFDKSKLKALPTTSTSSVASTPSGSGGGISDKPPLTKSVSLPAPAESASDAENNWEFKGMSSPRKAQQIARGLIDASTKTPQNTSPSGSNEGASSDKSQVHSSKSTSSSTGRSSPITRSSSNPSTSSDPRNLRRRKQVFDPRTEAVMIIPKPVQKVTKSVAESIISKHLPVAGSSAGAGTSKDNFVKSGMSSLPPTSKPKPITPFPTSKAKPASPMASFVGGEIRMNSTNNPSNPSTSSEKNQSAKTCKQSEKSTNNQPGTTKQSGHQSEPQQKPGNEGGISNASTGIVGAHPNESSTSRTLPIAAIVTARGNPPTGLHTSSGNGRGERNVRGRAQHERQDGLLPAPLIRPPTASPPAIPLMSMAVTVDFDTPPDVPASHDSPHQDVNSSDMERGGRSSGSSQDHNHNGRRSGSADRGRNSRRRNYGGGSNNHHRGGQHNHPPGLMQVPFGQRSPPSFYEYGPRFPLQPPQFRFENQIRGSPRPPFRGHHNSRNFEGDQRSTSRDRSNRRPNNYR